MAERRRTVPIVELFGPVIQGEGAMIGRQTHFVRLGGCDFRCSWCDTPYAVLPDEVRTNSTKMTPGEIVDRLKGLGPATPWVTLSGGNPALHELGPLVDALHAAGYAIAVETQGTIFREWLRRCEIVTVSPKPPSSGMEQEPGDIQSFIDLPGINLKIVVFDDDDLEFVRKFHTHYRHIPCYVQVGNTVGVDTTESLLRKLDWLSNAVMEDPVLADVIVLPQLHVLMYGNRRGV
jgi:7-carboxy-7-deazaguanine synthase